MKLSLGDITISSIGKSSAVFLGKKNTLRQFQNESFVNEVIGSVSGTENTLKQGIMIKNKVKEG
ncbi:hypothetical protein [Neobacillus mesonae]|uniref:Uncharacterized protein n=1 Tax=Neobacillus mesonae TaxID=1193713 RepID=A0A3Q9QZL1_9BACI|nr:hypothetical protein [Neobacillus mesonae]AZU64050.1 hypothetical protein CHR53_23880 [Neobacillus mesonae]